MHGYRAAASSLLDLPGPLHSRHRLYRLLSHAHFDWVSHHNLAPNRSHGPNEQIL